MYFANEDFYLDLSFERNHCRKFPSFQFDGLDLDYWFTLQSYFSIFPKFLAQNWLYIFLNIWSLVWRQSIVLQANCFRNLFLARAFEYLAGHHNRCLHPWKEPHLYEKEVFAKAMHWITKGISVAEIWYANVFSQQIECLDTLPSTIKKYQFHAHTS